MHYDEAQQGRIPAEKGGAAEERLKMFIAQIDGQIRQLRQQMGPSAKEEIGKLEAKKQRLLASLGGKEGGSGLLGKPMSYYKMPSEVLPDDSASRQRERNLRSDAFLQQELGGDRRAVVLYHRVMNAEMGEVLPLRGMTPEQAQEIVDLVTYYLDAEEQDGPFHRHLRFDPHGMTVTVS